MGQIIANHTIVADYNKIPQQYIDLVKTKLVWVAGMSHAVGYQNGVTLLNLLNNIYDASTYSAVPIPGDTDECLRLGKIGLSGAGTWSNPFWRTYLEIDCSTQNATGNPYDVYFYAPCWEMTWNYPPGGTIDPVYNVRWAGDDAVNGRYGLDAEDASLTGNPNSIDTYLASMEQWNAYSVSTNIPTLFVYTTGPVDDNSATENGFQRELKHTHIREYVTANPSTIFFDYADILVYNNDGERYTVDWNDDGSLRAHDQIHPDNLLNYDASWNEGPYPHELPEDHIGEVGALRLGKAIWWTLARIAGWDGVDASLPLVDTSIASYIYTISASCGGYISYDGSSSIIMAGICISTNINPIVTDISTKDASTTGYFYSSLLNLSTNTHYHARAYAYNSYGISYGTDVSFNTLPPANGSIYFVATDGSDNYAGTNIAKPWATWQKAINVAEAGDVVYFRGGIWYPTTFAESNNALSIIPRSGIGHNGAPGNPICYYNYPGEVPIFDCSLLVAPGTYPSNRYITGLMMYDTNWINWRGLTIRHVMQREANVEPKGICGFPISNMTFDRITLHDIGGCGWYLETDVDTNPADISIGWGTMGYVPYSNFNFINCDTYNCADFFPVNDGQVSGNLGDGFKFIVSGYANITYEGCRAWRISDDGWDIPSGTATVTLNNCWSFNNVYAEYPNWEGNGYKILGGSNDKIITKGKKITNCIAANCDLGLYYMDSGGTIESPLLAYNNFFYRDKIALSMRQTLYYDSMLNYYRNNLIYGLTSNDAGGRPYVLDFAINYTESNNTFDFAGVDEVGSLPWFKMATDISISDADFLSLDVSELMRPRKADGSLPDVSFGHLVAGSQAVGFGINLGLTYDGEGTLWKNPPSIGAFEYDGDSSVLSIVITTNSIADISSYTAKCGGNVTHDGSIALTYKGICWNTAGYPTVFDTSTQNASTGEGTYDSSLSNLNANTLYYVKAFAYNSDGIAYGQDVSFYTSPGLPTIYILPIINISTGCASSGGYISNDGSAIVTDRGICWNTSINPTISNSHTHDSSGIGSFWSNITGLNANTLYYARTYATNTYGTAYSADSSFSTSTPTVTTTEITDISTSSATSGGNVISDGSAAVTDRGICWSTSPNPTTANLNTHTHDGAGLGSYVSYIAGLNPGISYYVRAFAKNSAGTAYGANVNFTTSSGSDVSTYYVATDGSDSYPGTLAQPWATWQKAFDEASAGHTVYFRGGTWYLSANEFVIHDPSGIISGVHGHNGTADNPICFYNYPGEEPILDASGHTNTSDATAFDIRNSTYLRFKGLTIRNEKEHIADQWKASMQFSTNGWLHLENIKCHDGGGYGIWFGGYSTLYLINCDSYNHASVLQSDPGNRADGFQISSGSDVSDYTYIYGCRAWHNSDDGIEISTQRELYVSNCWTFGNGYLAYGAGVGFHLGPAVEDASKRKICNSIIAYNLGDGFTENNLNHVYNGPAMSFFNNIVYECNIGFTSSPGTWDYSTGYANDILKNNIVYGSVPAYFSACNYLYPTYVHYSNNTFRDKIDLPYSENDPAFSVSVSDFVAVPTDVSDCIAILSAPRKSDGSLPDVSVFHLVANSDLIYAGTYVDSCTYDGAGNPWHNPPSLGPFEYDASVDASTSTPTVTTTSITDISTYTATGGGNVTHDGSISLTYRGICVSTNASPTTLDVSIQDVSTGEGSYSLNLTNLNASTHYHVRAFAYNSDGISYGIDVSFNTLAPYSTPTVTTTSISDISTYTATSGGNVTHDGSIALTYRGICWSTSASPTTLDTSSLNASTGEGTYVSYLSALSASTHYYVRAFAYNSQGTSYGIDVSFNTLAATPAPEVSTNITYIKLANGKMLSISGKYLYA